MPLQSLTHSAPGPKGYPGIMSRELEKLIFLLYKKSPDETSGLGAENETRTRDPDLGKVVLYQLSYFRIFFKNVVKLVICT